MGAAPLTAGGGRTVRRRVAREGGEARVVVMEAGVVRHVLEAPANRFDCVGIALLTVRRHRVSMERPRVPPVERLVRLAGGGAESEDGSVARRLPLRLRPDEYECSCGRVDGLAVDLEGRRPVKHDVQLFLTRPRLVMRADEYPALARRVGVDSECADPEVLTHGDVSVAPLDVVEARHLPIRIVVHPASLERGLLRTVDPTRRRACRASLRRFGR